jgi:hypothetical protein
MRRGVTAKDEMRLLDSLLAPIGRADAEHQERTELQQRLAVIDQALSDAKERRRSMEHERSEIRTRLREIRKAERAAG